MIQTLRWIKWPSPKQFVNKSYHSETVKCQIWKEKMFSWSCSFSKAPPNLHLNCLKLHVDFPTFYNPWAHEAWVGGGEGIRVILRPAVASPCRRRLPFHPVLSALQFLWPVAWHIHQDQGPCPISVMGSPPQFSKWKLPYFIPQFLRVNNLELISFSETSSTLSSSSSFLFDPWYLPIFEGIVNNNRNVLSD